MAEGGFDMKCAYCGKEFEPRRSTQKFCSNKCCGAYHSRKQYRADPEANKLRMKKFRADNPGYDVWTNKKWRLCHPESYKASTRRYYLLHRDEILRKCRERNRRKKENAPE